MFLCETILSSHASGSKLFIAPNMHAIHCLTQPQHHQCLIMHLADLPKKSTLRCGTRDVFKLMLTSSKNISNYHKRILTYVIQSSGGQAVVPSFQIYHALLVTSFQYQVRLKFSWQKRAHIAHLWFLLLPGSAVAVERIFSGGRDTISLHRASLKPDTIRTLMLVKQRLRLARTAIQDLLGD